MPRKGLIGPWAHAYPHFAKPGPQIGFLQEMLRWWDHWLKGKPTGVMDEPMLRAWMTESHRPASHHETLPGRWVAEPAWPPRDRKPHRLFLTDSGLAVGERAARAARCALAANGRQRGRRMVSVRPRPRSGGRPASRRHPLAAVRDAAARRDHGDPGRAGRHARPRLRQACRQPGGPAVRRPSVGRIAARELRRAEPHASRQPRRAVAAGAGASAIACACSSTIAARRFPAGHRIRLALSTAYWPMVWPAPHDADRDDPRRHARSAGAAAAARGCGAAALAGCRDGATGPRHARLRSWTPKASTTSTSRTTIRPAPSPRCDGPRPSGAATGGCASKPDAPLLHARRLSPAGEPQRP